MNTSKIAVLVVVGVMFGGLACAGKKSTDAPAAISAEEHASHHPEAEKKPMGGQGDQMGGMMGGTMGMMDMHQMMGMMSQCMEMHKDGKMCDQDMMAQCQKNMSKKECSKMMNQAKKEAKKK